ncbi:MAG: response regulator transcription factor [Steroidobacteraceae bacterium]|nr:response regulator transcription factor [Nevskiaceae bacterium]MCP5338869.1 response regulator transcription factor [Nevskiaceae bacterium]MCP5360742.1 response regulator transcription factor [Nevskiaceae bacterium]MCP5466216.1 response regulator transcription factor [Nevskiaceae bacterium]MCP5471618.1 response regulator transcription factor [Nevskiaceae bacterium]
MEQNGPRILLIDDDVALASMLREFLELQGFQVGLAHDAESGLARLADDPPDLLVLDVMLPGISGFEALKRLRQRHDLPVIMLTARGEEAERILGLMDGADDYLAKPCSPLELAVRIRTILKRARPTPAARAVDATVLRAGPIQLDLRRREAQVLGCVLSLTAAEMRLLEQLLRHPGEVLSRARLTQLALDRPIEAYDRSIDTLISRLRRKLEAAGASQGCIGGLRGQGYVLDPERVATREHS